MPELACDYRDKLLILFIYGFTPGAHRPTVWPTRRTDVGGPAHAAWSDCRSLALLPASHYVGQIFGVRSLAGAGVVPTANESEAVRPRPDWLLAVASPN